MDILRIQKQEFSESKTRNSILTRTFKTEVDKKLKLTQVLSGSKSGLPPIPTKKTEFDSNDPIDQLKRQIEQKQARDNIRLESYSKKGLKIFEDNIMLINPVNDCSENELFSRNGFKVPSKTI